MSPRPRPNPKRRETSGERSPTRDQRSTGSAGSSGSRRGNGATRASASSSRSSGPSGAPRRGVAARSGQPKRSAPGGLSNGHRTREDPRTAGQRTAGQRTAGRRTAPTRGAPAPRSGAPRGAGPRASSRAVDHRGSAPRAGASNAKKGGRPRSPGGQFDRRRPDRQPSDRRWPDRRPSDRRQQERRPPDRRELGGDQIEGRQAVLELLAAGRRPVRQVWIAEGLDPSPELDRITSLAHHAGARLLVVPSRRLDAEARTRSHQGVLALAAPLKETSLDEICEPVESGGTTRPPFILVLDGVTDPQNVGALLRIAECAGVTGVVLARHGAAHVTPTVAKVAAGAVEHLRISLAPGIPTAVARLATAGVTCIGLDAGAGQSIYEIAFEGFDEGSGVALVLGDESRGLSSLTRRRCKFIASIPQHGTIGSLNVAAAGAVACFEIARHMGGGVLASSPGD